MPLPGQRSNWMACHDCDALFEAPQLQLGESALCPQCGATLDRHRQNPVHRSAALAVSAMAFFVVANFFPFIELEAGGQISRIVLAESVSALSDHGSPWLGAAVAIFILGAPFVMISGLLYLLLPLIVGRRLPGAIFVCRVVYGTNAWNMIEVFLIGVLVSLLKLGDIATVTLGISFWAFGALIVCLTSAVSAIEPRGLWDRMEEARA